MTSRERDPNFFVGFPLKGTHWEGSSGRRTAGPLPPLRPAVGRHQSEPSMSTPLKRPYVPPRVGHSMLRSLWYLFAFTGVLAVAFMIPHKPTPPEPVMDGNWKLEAQEAAGGLPPGQVYLMIQGEHYALEFEGSDPDLASSGFERGHLEMEDGTMVLTPEQGVYLDKDGNWTRQLPRTRRLRVTMDEERLILTDQAGNTLSGQSH